MGLDLEAWLGFGLMKGREKLGRAVGREIVLGIQRSHAPPCGRKWHMRPDIMDAYPSEGVRRLLCS